MCALIWAIFIPRVNKSIYFNSTDGNQSSGAFRIILRHFKSSYSSRIVVIWSMYYAISVCFYNQIVSYIQVLWITIDDTEDDLYNGAVDAVLTTLSVASSLLAGRIYINFLKSESLALITLIAMTSLQGIFIILASLSQSLISCYILYICYGMCYAFGITICATEIARNLPEDTYGLIFGFNTLAGLIFQSLVTVTFVSSGFLLSPRGQYQVYSYSFFILAGIFLLIFVTRTIRRWIENLISCVKVTIFYVLLDSSVGDLDKLQLFLIKNCTNVFHNFLIKSIFIILVLFISYKPRSL